ncbi:hypothetical protein Bca4012_051942 [Brassica carinata]|uniref:Auxin-responsive protein n=1 Tax=Brassica carinata TaxID=52824 RepID=A0A8X7R7E3_BRACI|nr:hypothetical protein Bca52824_054485 [Brassica carinata]
MKVKNQRLAQGYKDGEEDRGKLDYVKVNMNGLVVSRKVCVLDEGTYSTLSLQLDSRFGKLCSKSETFCYKYVSEALATSILIWGNADNIEIEIVPV